MTYTREQLKQIDEMPIKNVYGKIVVLDFKEKPLAEIQGLITQGSMSCNGSAAIRRTINLTLAAFPEYTAITNVDNLISINKKVKVLMGVQGTGEIFWFPLGLYVLSTANIQHQTTALTISITGKDKMCRLDGSAGGTLPASVVFNEKIEYKNGVRVVHEVPIAQIIRSALIQYGEEQDNKIIIADLDVSAKALIRYNHNSPLWIKKTDNSFKFTAPKTESDYKKVTFGEDIGYFETDLTYPGQLMLNAGETVVSLLDKIVKALGNYEFFYDIEGNFIFQEKKNYLNKRFSFTKENYISTFLENEYAYVLDNTRTISSISSNPKYDNIKNEFIIWGQKTTTSGANVPILYHLVVDEKPALDLSLKWLYGKITNALPEEDVRWSEFEAHDSMVYGEGGEVWELIGSPTEEWREELYRQALMRSTSGTTPEPYDAELISFWRDIYYPNKDTKVMEWKAGTRKNPELMSYWLDFLDSSQLKPYSVKEIGRRTKVVNNDKIKTIANKPVEDIIFLNGSMDGLVEKTKEFNDSGQDFAIIPKDYYNYFGISSTGASAYDTARELLYQHLVYNNSISITCTPKYFLEPNTLIYIKDADAAIEGSFVITQFTLPLTYNGMMTISAAEALTRE